MENIEESTETPMENIEESTELVENIGANTETPVENIEANTEAPVENIESITEAPTENMDQVASKRALEEGKGQSIRNVKRPSSKWILFSSERRSTRYNFTIINELFAVLVYR